MKRPEGFDRKPEAQRAPSTPPPARQRPLRKISPKPETTGERALPQSSRRPPEQPKATKPGAAKPGAAKPGAAQPGVTKPGAAKPGAAKPSRSEQRRLAREDAAIIAAATASIRKQDRVENRAKKAEARRFTRSLRRRRIIGFTAAGIVALLVAVLAFAVFSPVLALRTITVVGTTKVNPADIRSALDDQKGIPLALLDESKIRSDLGRFTLIRSYSTQIVPPNTLVVRIVERQPIAVLKNGSSFDRIDAAGVVIESTSKRGTLPVLDVGGQEPSSRAFRSAVQVLLALPASLAPRVQAVSATTADDVSLTLAGSARTVVWGAAASSSLKAKALEAMLRQAACKTQAVIDVSAPRAPICGPAHS